KRRNNGLPLNTAVLQRIYDNSGGRLDDRPVKAVIPRRASAAMSTGDNLDFKMDFDTLAGMGSMLGSGGVIIMDDRTCIPCAVRRIEEISNDEACGKSTPCREGTMWKAKNLRRTTTGAALACCYHDLTA